MSNSALGAIIGIVAAVWAGPLAIAFHARRNGHPEALRRTVTIVIVTLVVGGLSVGWVASAPKPPTRTFVCPPAPADCPWQTATTDL